MRVIVAVACLALGSVVQAQVSYDMASLQQAVKPMQHSLNGFMPIHAASLPIPTNDGAVTLRNNGTLAQYVDALWARGISTAVAIGGGHTTDAGAVATALTVQEAGLPIHVWSYLPESSYAFWPAGAPRWFTDMQGAQWPVFPLATPTVGYNFVRQNLETLQNAGISAVSGLWMDYEGHPYPYVNIKASVAQRTYASQYYTDAYAAGNGILPSSYPPDLLTDDTFDAQQPMWRYTYDLRYALLKQSARQALTDVFGTTPIFGNYDAYYSSATTPYRGNYPPSPPPEQGIAAMPVAYANTFYLANDYTDNNPAGVPLNQTTADADYWYTMLTAVSTSQANNGSLGRSVVWVSYNTPDNANQPWINYGEMTPSVYKEFLRHVWLRGASGMYVFNRDPIYQPAQQSFNELEFARSVLDEMLSFRSFLTNGVPMNFAVSSARWTGDVEWSGLSNSASNPTQWLVRAVSRSGTAGTVPSITPQPGLTFTNIPAPTDGATYLLNADASMHRVDTRPATAYLQLDGTYADASGNGNTGNVCWKWPANYPNPTFSSAVAGASVRTAAYGLYADAQNQFSLETSRDPGSPFSGNGLCIPNTNDALNASSFTVETFVRVAAGSQDAATIISKGAAPSPEQLDWMISYRDFAGAGMLELTFGHSSPTPYAWIRTAGTPLTPGVWHHLALTYDGATRRATLYVDHVPQTFGIHNDQVSADGVLAWDIARHTGDKMVLGYFDRAINANFDDVRFTPEVLDPKQFLALGTLQ